MSTFYTHRSKVCFMIDKFQTSQGLPLSKTIKSNISVFRNSRTFQGWPWTQRRRRNPARRRLLHGAGVSACDPNPQQLRQQQNRVRDADDGTATTKLTRSTEINSDDDGVRYISYRRACRTSAFVGRVEKTEQPYRGLSTRRQTVRFARARGDVATKKPPVDNRLLYRTPKSSETGCRKCIDAERSARRSAAAAACPTLIQRLSAWSGRSEKNQKADRRVVACGRLFAGGRTRPIRPSDCPSVTRGYIPSGSTAVSCLWQRRIRTECFLCLQRGTRRQRHKSVSRINLRSFRTQTFSATGHKQNSQNPRVTQLWRLKLPHCFINEVVIALKHIEKRLHHSDLKFLKKIHTLLKSVWRMMLHVSYQLRNVRLDV